MWYRIKVNDDLKYVNDAILAEMGITPDAQVVQTKNKWLFGVVNELDAITGDKLSDGEVLDMVIQLVDEGELNI